MSALGIRVLVVDDEPPIRRLLRMGLGSQGYTVIEVENGAAALAGLAGIDLVILDLGLPDMSGHHVLAAIRAARPNMPVIILSSRDDEAGKVEALDLGADDYVTKPFGMAELLARVRTALRHRLQPQNAQPIFQTAHLSIDLLRRIVKRGDMEVKLTPKEYDILRAMAEHAGQVLTHAQLIQKAWGHPVDPQYLRIFIRQLRHKVEIDPERPNLIVTETGVGYRLRSEET